VRLWALGPLADRGSVERRTRILEDLGVNPGDVARAAAGEPLSGAR
jgi:hypothetical protein